MIRVLHYELLRNHDHSRGIDLLLILLLLRNELLLELLRIPGLEDNLLS